MAALVATNWTGGDGSQLPVEIGVAEWLADDSKTFQVSKNGPEPLLRFDPAENEVRVVIRRRQMSACDFDARMASLNSLLGEG